MNKNTFEIDDKKKQIGLILCVALGAFMANLDLTIVNVSLPDIAHEFNVSPGPVSKIVLVYSLFEAGLLLFFAKLGDIKGFRKTYIAGFILFTVGSLLCGISHSINGLIVYRGLQGIGGALLFSVMMATIALYIPVASKGRAMGYVTTAAAVGVALGPPFGGFINSWLSWRWIFFINIPVGIIAILMGLKFLPKKFPKPEDSRIDYAGAFLLLTVLISLIYTLNLIKDFQHISGNTAIPVFVFIISSALLYFREKKIDFPVIDSSILKNRFFVLAAIASLPSFMTTAGTLFILPFFFQAKGVQPHVTGLILTALAAGQLFGPMAGSISDKIGAKKVLIGGIIVSIISFIMFVMQNLETSIFYTAAALFIFGASLSFQKAPNIQLALSFIPGDKKGEGAGIMAVLRSIGMLFGVLFFEIVFSLSSYHKSDIAIKSISRLTNQNEIIESAFRNSFILGLILITAGLIPVFLIRENRQE